MALHKHTPEQRELMKKAQAKKKAKPAKKGLPFAKIGKKKKAAYKTREMTAEEPAAVPEEPEAAPEEPATEAPAEEEVG